MTGSKAAKRCNRLRHARGTRPETRTTATEQGVRRGMAAPEAAQDRPAEHTEGPERRAYPRHAVDCAVVVFSVSGSVQLQGRLLDLSLGGCRVAAEHRYTAGI